MRSLPPHDDVKEGLRRLQEKGFRLYALTNGSEDTLNDQIHNAGLGDFFEGLLSVDRVRKFKPHREVYEWAAKETGTAKSDCVLIAAHPWDIAGAGWAGWQTVYLQRSPTPPFGLANTPDYTIEELRKLVQELE
jgi:2-haloacid dehalogenase